MAEVTNFLIVLTVAVCVAGTISFMYAWGLRLWSQGTVDAQGNAPLMTRLGSVLCFAVCVAIVLFALWLMIPMFH